MASALDYLQTLQPVDLSRQFSQGLQSGLAVRAANEKLAAEERARVMREQYSADLQSALQSGSPDAFLRLNAKYPGQKEALEPLWKSADEKARESEFTTGVQAYNAIKQGKPEVASSILDDSIKAHENSGKDATKLKKLRQMMDVNPDGVANSVGMFLSAVEPEKWGKVADEFRKQELQPYQVDSEKKSQIPSSILEAIEFGKLTPEQQSTFKSLQVLKHPPGAVTNVKVGSLEKASGEELAKLLPAMHEQANAAVSHVSELPRYRAALNVAITGPMAEQRLAADRIASALGFKGDSAVTATRELIQGLSEMALKSRSTLTGSGAITDFEQRLLLKARSGDINFTKNELETLFKVSERAARAQYARNKRLLKSAASKSETAQMFLDNVDDMVEESDASKPAGTGNEMPAGFTIIRRQ